MWRIIRLLHEVNTGEKDDFGNPIYIRRDEMGKNEKERIVLNSMTDINFLGYRVIKPEMLARSLYNIQRIIEKNIFNSK